MIDNWSRCRFRRRKWRHCPYWWIRYTNWCRRWSSMEGWAGQQAKRDFRAVRHCHARRVIKLGDIAATQDAGINLHVIQLAKIWGGQFAANGSVVCAAIQNSRLAVFRGIECSVDEDLFQPGTGVPGDHDVGEDR